MFDLPGIYRPYDSNVQDSIQFSLLDVSTLNVSGMSHLAKHWSANFRQIKCSLNNLEILFEKINIWVFQGHLSLMEGKSAKGVKTSKTSRTCK